ncbi:MAG: L-threonylcarbamoyladenylate synthase [Acidobacteriota bacterium]|nr:L-threonylcarbamoyladenylate synthase [Acidobacteriota bacterium]
MDVIAADDDDALERAARVIARGGVVAVPTETFYGLAADATHEMAAARIFAIKGRPAAFALPVVAASYEQVDAILGPIDAATIKAARRFWPGPLSLVLAAPHTLARHVHGGGGTIAVRVPGAPFVRALAEHTGMLLTATSANRTGALPAETAEQVAAALGEDVDLIIDGGRTPGGKPSTIADLRGAVPQLVRDGAIAWERVLAFLARNGRA